ncbi:sulfotransferase 1C2-like [Polypterus senegalus]|uniref:sulfotransferase 1C2-like n=1 Tax=Polypterus senegalus TaxID=55291 RepID=UPI001964624C|nr:sulfotransferase 1C2-like [Polypterus senegalus]
MAEDCGIPGSLLKVERQTLYEVDGVPMMRRFFEYNEKIRNFEAKPDDVLVATYPKAGTTWMIEIVDCILSGGVTDKIRNQPSGTRAPFIELCKSSHSYPGVDILDATPSPRLVNTHLPVKLVPPSFWESNCRIIYVARNAKDVLVSYYFFHKLNLRMPETGSWEEFFESYLSGKVAWGSWFDHVTTWWDIRQRQQVLYIFYEDIVQDPQRVIERVSPFLGRTFGRTVIDEIMKHTAFSNMKDNPMTNFSNLPWFNLKVSPFMRKGKVGDWKNHFTVAQNERFEKEYQRRMAKTSLRFTDDL